MNAEQAFLIGGVSGLILSSIGYIILNIITTKDIYRMLGDIYNKLEDK